MVGSLNTNLGAQIALQNLNVTNTDLGATEKRISTGLRVSDAFDNGAVFAIAQGLRSDLSAITAVNGQLGAAKGLLAVANTALNGVSNTLSDLRSVLVQLADQNVTGNARSQLNAQFGTLVGAIQNYVNGAYYNGSNLLATNVASGLSQTVNVIQDTNAAQHALQLPPIPPATTPDGVLSAFWTPWVGADSNGNLIVGEGTPSDATAAASLLTQGFASAQNYVGTALNQIAADSKFIDNQITFNIALSDATNQGLGALVDADLAKESARLQSLQIKQQLGSQSLGIANQTPQILLGLFR